MESFQADFALHDGQRLTLNDLVAKVNTLSGDNKYVELVYQDCEGVVAQLIVCLLWAKTNDVPLLLNRTGQKLPQDIVQNMPAHFALGMLTSGTTGTPKWVFLNEQKILPKHINTDKKSKWLLCYHPFSYAGMQVILQAMLSGDELYCRQGQSVAGKALFASEHRLTALSCTPSYFRAMSMAWGAPLPPLHTLSFGGEICDQATLTLARSLFPSASIRHIYATTESGVLFSVKDQQAGFPLRYLQDTWQGWQLEIIDQQGKRYRHKHDVLHEQEYTLQLSTQRGDKIQTIATGDIVRVQGERILFVGRNDNVVNIGGEKVNLESLEAQLISLAAVNDARVYAKPSPITSYVLCAEVVSMQPEQAKQQVMQWKQGLAPAQQLRVIQWVDEITLSEANKKIRISQ